jgi:hypothetical protein
MVTGASLLVSWWHLLWWAAFLQAQLCHLPSGQKPTRHPSSGDSGAVALLFLPTNTSGFGC